MLPWRSKEIGMAKPNRALQLKLARMKMKLAQASQVRKVVPKTLALRLKAKQV